MSDDLEELSDFAEEEATGYEAVTLKLPSLTVWSGKQIYNYSEQIADYHSLQELGAAISQARRSLFLLTDKINEYERKARLSKMEYDRTFRKEYLGSTEKTESAKRARAELRCEELENEWVKNDQLKNELIRMSYTMKTELQALQTIANNLRQQLKMED